MTDDQFMQFIANCHRELSDKQSTFWPMISESKHWQYELGDCSIQFDDSSYPIVPIGTFHQAHGTWMWAWAHTEFPEAARSRSQEIQRLKDSTGFHIFLDAAFPVQPEEVNDIVALSIHQLDAIGFFVSRSDEPTLYLAVMSKG